SGNEDLKLLDELGTTLDIEYNKFEDGKINLPISRSFYLEKLMDSNQNIKVAKNDKFTELIDSIENNEEKNSEETENIKLDEELENKLRDYQKVGYKWLKNLEKYHFGRILADDMGLGKTLQIIALLSIEKKSKKKTTSIVVCPSTLVLNWKAEVEKWCNDINVLSLKGTAEERKEKINDYEQYDLIITSYDLLKRDIENYEDKYFKYIIADEAQYIKNSNTQNATSLKSLKGEIKFALTGTPIENSVAELWSIFDFIMPGYLYNYNKFKKKFEEPILKYEDKETLNRLKKLISPFILRRVKKDVLTELPEKNITFMKSEMEEEQEKIYLSYLAQTKKEVAEELNESSFEKSKFKILMLLTRLRQICCHPSLFIENYKGNSGKLKQCIDLIVDAIESGHKILLFSSYTSMFEIMEKELNKHNIEYFKLVGNTPVNERIEMVEEFNNNENIKVFLISLKAGGTGLNLTSADVVIHYDPWWNLSAENQATDRAYRMGQKNSVQVYKLITSNSIEEKINKMQERKEKLSKDILSTEETFISKLSKEDIMDLFE
ncbi:MAG: DEAD/DEAH box helicase, partial [Clostridia bacterium]|nr:DEAD/DEAH box helicase [Clostridia bacterium]